MKTNPLTPGLLHKMDAYLLASHVWQHVINKKADIVRVYLPPDANCLLSVFDHCLRSRHYVNVAVYWKQAHADWRFCGHNYLCDERRLGVAASAQAAAAAVRRRQKIVPPIKMFTNKKSL
jgi:hypothetical protein